MSQNIRKKYTAFYIQVFKSHFLKITLGDDPDLNPNKVIAPVSLSESAFS